MSAAEGIPEQAAVALSVNVTHDPVNHPSHYTNGEIECIDAIEAALGMQGFVAYCRGNVIKYSWRTGSKNQPEQDIAKAAWYARRAEVTIKKFIESVK